MVLAALILIPAIALFFFYLQATCQRILRQQFNQEYFLAIANANRLEVPAVPHVGRIQASASGGSEWLDTRAARHRGAGEPRGELKFLPGDPPSYRPGVSGHLPIFFSLNPMRLFACLACGGL